MRRGLFLSNTLYISDMTVAGYLPMMGITNGADADG